MNGTNAKVSKVSSHPNANAIASAAPTQQTNKASYLPTSSDQSGVVAG